MAHQLSHTRPQPIRATPPIPFWEHAKALEAVVKQERLAVAVCGGLAAFSLAGPIVFKDWLPKPVIGLSLAISTLSSGLGGAIAQSGQERDAKYQAMRKVQRQVFDDHLKHSAAKAVADQLYWKRVGLFKEMLRTQSAELWPVYVEANGLQDIYAAYMAEATRYQTAADVIDAVPVASNAIAVNPLADTSQFDLTARSEPIDYSWIDDKFIAASKAVFAPKGSGKSFWLSFEAAEYVKRFPDGVLWIADPHFDETEETYLDDETVWLNGIPKSVLFASDGKLGKISLIKEFEHIYKAFKLIGRLLHERAAKGQKIAKGNVVRIKFICDEFDGVMRRATPPQQDEIAGIIQAVQDEGRKYGIDITLSMHSLKKELTRIDSTAVAQMDVLALGNALADPNTRFPGDIDSKKLLEEQQALRDTLNPKRDGYAAVVRKLNDRPQAVVIPPINPYAYTFTWDGTSDSTVDNAPDDAPDAWDEPTYSPTIDNNATQPQSWLEQIEAVLARAAKPLAASEIAALYQQLTGSQLDAKGLQYLVEMLRDRGNPNTPSAIQPSG